MLKFHDLEICRLKGSVLLNIISSCNNMSCFLLNFILVNFQVKLGH